MPNGSRPRLRSSRALANVASRALNLALRVGEFGGTDPAGGNILEIFLALRRALLPAPDCRGTYGALRFLDPVQLPHVGLHPE